MIIKLGFEQCYYANDQTSDRKDHQFAFSILKKSSVFKSHGAVGLENTPSIEDELLTQVLIIKASRKM